MVEKDVSHKDNISPATAIPPEAIVRNARKAATRFNHQIVTAALFQGANYRKVPPTRPD